MHLTRTTTIAIVAMLGFGCSGAEAPVANDGTLQYVDLPADAAPAPAELETGKVGRAGGGTGRDMSTVPARTVSAEPGQGTATLPGIAQPAGQTAPSMIIRVGQAAIEVDSLEPAVASVQALALQLGGYVANVSLHSGQARVRTATLMVKVPAARFDAALESLEPIGKLESLEVSAEDVGEEYADIEARVSNAKRLEQRLLSLLATRTGRLEDILAAERELARVREEIERYEGRMRYLQARATLSTLQITVHEPAPILGRNARNPIVDAFRGAWRNFVNFVAGLIEISGILIPLAAIGFLIVLAWRKWGPDFGRAETTTTT